MTQHDAYVKVLGECALCGGTARFSAENDCYEPDCGEPIPQWPAG